MDNLAHSLVGLTAAKTGLDRFSPAATTVCILAANSPDSDIVWLLTSGRWSFLHNHRGITHSIAGTLVLGVLIPTLCWVGDRALARLRKRRPVIRYRGLLLASVIAAATHPLLDWTNNYGVRLLLPWNSRWFYGDLVFIIDPFIWLVVGAAAFLLTSNRRLTLIGWIILAIFVTAFVMLASRQNVNLSHPYLVRGIWLGGVVILTITRAMRRHIRPGRALAFASFAVVLLYWCALGWAHSRASNKAALVAELIKSQSQEQPVRSATMPTLADPFRWQCVVETDRAIYRFVVDLTDNELVAGAQSDRVRTDGHPPGLRRFAKPSGLEALLVSEAEKDSRAQILLEFARFPFGRAQDPDCIGQTLVEFADLRYTEPGTSRGTFSLNVTVDCPQRPIPPSKLTEKTAP